MPIISVLGYSSAKPDVKVLEAIDYAIPLLPLD
jgi:hypothetical protein